MKTASASVNVMMKTVSGLEEESRGEESERA
jgi:hypothetical protein